jgi:PEGA domain-containing protein
MKRRMAIAVVLAFAATSASAGHASGGRSGGGHSSGGHFGGGHSSGGHVSRGGFSGGRVFGGHSSRGFVSASRQIGALVTRGFSSGPRYTSGRGGYGYYGGGHAVPRGSAGYAPRSGASYRRPRVGFASGFAHGRSYGRRYGYGYRSYGYRSYGRFDYGRYPYGYRYGYFPYGWAALDLAFSLGAAYPYLGWYDAPYDIGYVGDEPYWSGGSARDEDYYDREDPRDDARAEGAALRLTVVPDDASVWIDGAFRGAARDLVRLPLRPGRHEVEVVRPGFRTAAREIEVHAGTTASLRIELERP